MNEEALQQLYTLSKSEGYTKSFDDFKALMSSNEGAINDMYGVAKKEGYQKSIDDFKLLVGFGQVKKNDSPSPEATAAMAPVTGAQEEEPISSGSESNNASTFIDPNDIAPGQDSNISQEFLDSGVPAPEPTTPEQTEVAPQEDGGEVTDTPQNDDPWGINEYVDDLNSPASETFKKKILKSATIEAERNKAEVIDLATKNIEKQTADAKEAGMSLSDWRGATEDSYAKEFLDDSDYEQYKISSEYNSLKATIEENELDANDPNNAEIFGKLKSLEKQKAQMRVAKIQGVLTEIRELKAQLPGASGADRDEIVEQVKKLQASITPVVNPVKYATEKAKTEEVQTMPGDTPLDKLKNYYHLRAQQMHDLQQETGFIDYATAAVPFVGDMVGSTEKRDKFLSLYNELQELTPIITINEATLKEDNWLTQVGKNVVSTVIAPGFTTTEQEQAETLYSAFDQADVSENISENAVEAISASFRQTTGEEFGATLGTTLGMMPYFVGGGRIVKAGKALGTGTKVATRLASVKNLSRTTKFLFGAVESGLSYEAAGLLTTNEVISDEASFLSGFLGFGMTKLAGKLVPQKFYNATMLKLFGSEASTAHKLFGKALSKTGAGIGEVFEEYGNELASIIEKSDNLNSFFELHKERFGDMDENIKFGLTTFVMGVGFGMATPSGKAFMEEHKAWLSEQSPEVQAKFAAIAGEVQADSEKVEAAMSEDPTEAETEQKAETTTTTETPEVLTAGDQVELSVEPTATETEAEAPSTKATVITTYGKEVSVDDISAEENYSFREDAIPPILKDVIPGELNTNEGAVTYTGQQLIDAGYAEAATKTQQESTAIETPVEGTETTQNEQPQDTEATQEEKQEIERRRQEELFNAPDEMLIAPMISNGKGGFIANPEIAKARKVKEKINAKYDAELADLEQQTTQATTEADTDASIAEEEQETYEKEDSSDDSIAKSVKGKRTVRDVIVAAREAGHTDEEILDHLVKKKKATKEKAKEYLGIDTETLKDTPESFLGGSTEAKAGVRLNAKVKKFKASLEAKNAKNTKLSPSEVKTKKREYAAKKRATYKTTREINEIAAKERAKQEKGNKTRKNKLSTAQINERVNKVREVENEKRAKLKAKADKDIARYGKQLDNRNDAKEDKLSQSGIAESVVEFIKNQQEYVAEQDTKTVGSKKKGTLKVVPTNVMSTQQAKMLQEAYDSVTKSESKANSTSVISELRKLISNRKKGGYDATKLQRKLKSFIKEHLSKGDYSKTDMKKISRWHSELNASNFDVTLSEVSDFILGKAVKGLQANIESILSGKYTKLDGGKRKGKGIHPDAKNRIAKIKSLLADRKNATESEVAEMNAKLLEQYYEILEELKLQNISDSSVLEEIQIAMDYNSTMLMDDSNPNKAKVLADVNERLTEIYTDGKSKLKEEIEEELQESLDDIVDALSEITGEPIDTDVEDLNEELDKKRNKKTLENARRKADRRVQVAIENRLKWIGSMFNMAEALNGLMAKISTLPGEIMGGRLQEMVTDVINAATRNYKDRMMKVDDQIKAKIEEIYGKKFRSDIKKNREMIATGVYRTDEKTPENEIILSQNQIAYFYNLYKDEKNHESFKNTPQISPGKDAKAEDIQRIMSELEAVMDSKVKEFADWQVDVLFPELYEHYNHLQKTVQDRYAYARILCRIHI